MLLGILGTNEIIILFILGIIIFFLIKSGRKVLAIVMLFVGLAFLIHGIDTLNKLDTLNSSTPGRLANTFSNNYRMEYANAKTNGQTNVTFGIILIIGSILLFATSKSTKRNDSLINTTRNNQPIAQLQAFEPSTSLSPNERFSQLEKLGKLRDQGILSDEEFQKEKKRILG